MIIAIVLICGGGPAGGQYDEFWGDRLWRDPGAFQNGFPGFCSVFVTAAFSYAGTELVGLAAAESSNPARALPGAVKQVFWRITLFYVLGLTLVGLLISSTDTNLLNSSNPYADGVSPFVLAGKYAGLVGFDHFMNLVICISVVSIGVSSVYGSSRTLTALGEQNYAPKIFTYIDKSGRPLVSVVFTMIFGALAYVSIAAGGMAVFDWLLSLSALSSLITWGSICFCHIRFRAAWKKQGRSMDLIPYKAFGGVYGSYLGLGLCILIFAAQCYVAAVPHAGPNSPERILQNILTVPVVAIFWVIGYFWKRPQWLSIDKLDLDTGLREHNWDEINEYRAKVAALPTWWRVIRNMFA
jgi:amino acid transporter